MTVSQVNPTFVVGTLISMHYVQIIIHLRLGWIVEVFLYHNNRICVLVSHTLTSQSYNLFTIGIGQSGEGLSTIKSQHLALFRLPLPNQPGCKGLLVVVVGVVLGVASDLTSDLASVFVSKLEVVLVLSSSSSSSEPSSEPSESSSSESE